MNSLSYPPVDPIVAETLTENWRNYYAGITKTLRKPLSADSKIPLSDLEKLRGHREKRQPDRRSKSLPRNRPSFTER